MTRQKTAKRIVDESVLAWVVAERDRACLWGLFGANPSPCGFGLDPHHVTKRSHGGNDVKENLITLCRKHHNEAEDNIIKPEDLRQILGRIYGYGL